MKSRFKELVPLYNANSAAYKAFVDERTPQADSHYSLTFLALMRAVKAHSPEAQQEYRDAHSFIPAAS